VPQSGVLLATEYKLKRVVVKAGETRQNGEPVEKAQVAADNQNNLKSKL
jgi:hypothetical protein